MNPIIEAGAAAIREKLNFLCQVDDADEKADKLARAAATAMIGAMTHENLMRLSHQEMPSLRAELLRVFTEGE